MCVVDGILEVGNGTCRTAACVDIEDEATAFILACIMEHLVTEFDAAIGAGIAVACDGSSDRKDDDKFCTLFVYFPSLSVIIAHPDDTALSGERSHVGVMLAD